MIFNIHTIRNICNSFLLAVALFSVVHARAFFSDSQTVISTDSISSLPLLQTSVHTSKPSRSVIKFAVFGGKAKLYVNGKKQKTRSGFLKQVEVSLRKTDVVGFRCTKTGPHSKTAGLMATITHEGKVYRTGIERFSTRGQFSKWKKWEKKSWDKVKVYKDKKSGRRHGFCHWKKAAKIAFEGKKFDSKASFIWRLTGKDKIEAAGSVFLRFVIGGEQCSGKNIEKNKVDMDEDEGDDDGDKEEDEERKGGKDDEDGDHDGDHDDGDDDDDDDDDDDRKDDREKNRNEEEDDDDDKRDRKGGDDSDVSGQNDESKADGFCACSLTTRRGGECYDMEEASASSGKCKPRPCEPKFECVASGEKMCVKRRGGKRVVMVSPNNCKTESADDVEMLLPYEG